MNKLAVATLAAVTSAHQLFLEMDQNGNTVSVSSVPQEALLGDSSSQQLYANGSRQKIIGYYTDWSTYARNF